MDEEVKGRSCLHAKNSYYRFMVLFFNCMLTFGSYFCFDMPSVLQDNFTGKFGWNCTQDHKTNTKTCKEHLGLSQTEYNLLYTVYAWTNAAVVIGAGVLIDKLGQGVGALLFSALCVIGSSTFAAGYFLKGHDSMFIVFLLGRLLFGAGNGSLTIAQNRVSAFWFEGKELAFAFGATLAFSSLGSILNFLLTENFTRNYGLKWTLWGDLIDGVIDQILQKGQLFLLQILTPGMMLCGIGFVASLVLFVLDRRGIKQLNKEEDLKSMSRKMRLRDILYLKIQFWLLAITTMFFYNTVFPFVADASEFIEKSYRLNPREASIYAGTVYDISLVLTPVLGISVDYVGYRGILASACAFFTIPVFCILAFAKNISPLVGTLLLGATYSAAASSLWPSVPLVVNPGVLGTAMGLMTFMQMIGIGTSNIVIGSLLDKFKGDSRKWKFVMLFLLANALACVVISIILNIVDWRRGGILNKTRKRRKRILKVRQDEDRDKLISYQDEDEESTPTSQASIHS